MGVPHDTQPLVGSVLERSDLFPDLVHQNLPPGARNSIEPRGAQPGDRVFYGHARQVRDVQDLRGGQAMDVDLEILFDGTEQVLVVLDP